MTSQHGQHGKPAAPILHWPRELCWFQLVKDVGCLGLRGRGLFGIIKTIIIPHVRILILLDESHVSRLLATCVSVGSLTAVTIQRISTRCQGDDALAPVVKVPFHDSLYC